MCYSPVVRPDRSEKLQGILFVNIATLSWATNIILGRHLRDEIGPLALTAGRYIVSAIVFALLLSRAPKQERRVGNDLLPLIAMAATGIVLFAPMLYFGLRFTTAINSTLINGTGPLLTALFAAWLIHEPYTRRQLAGALVAVAGVAVLITGTSPEPGAALGLNPGDVIVLAAAAVWGLYSVAGRRATRQRSPLSATAISTYMGLPVLVAAALVEQYTIPVVYSPRLALITVYLGVVPAALGFSMWNAGVKKLGAGGAMVFYNTLPLYGALLGYLLLGERLSVAHGAGGVLIIAGGLYSALARARSSRSSRYRRSSGSEVPDSP